MYQPTPAPKPLLIPSGQMGIRKSATTTLTRQWQESYYALFFPIVIIFFRGGVPEMFVTSYSVTHCIYVPGKPWVCFHYYCAVYDEYKYSDTFWLANRTRLFVQYTISLLSLCKLIWRHWTYKMPVRYILSSACVSKTKHILSAIHYIICGAVCFQFTHFCCDDWENIYTLSYYHLQIGSMNYYPLFRVIGHETMVSAVCLYILVPFLR